MSRRSSSHPSQHGVALLAAIFLLVVLSALALYMASLSGTQHFTSMWAVQGARAHYAAQSGLQWGASQAANGGGCTNNLTINAGAPFNVAVNCTSAAVVELDETRTVWTITATATSGGTIGSPGFVQRSQRMTVLQ
jgi:MSHA biogenesis protein MshP